MRRATIALVKERSPVGERPHGWRGLRLLVGFGVALLAVTATGCTSAEPKSGTDLAALPPEVRDALDRAAQVYAQPLSGVQWSKANGMSGTNHPVYQVQGTNGRGNKVELEVTSAGRVIEVEEHGIPQSEVPGAVIDALKAKMPHFTPTRVEAIYQAEGSQPASYGFEGPDADGRKTEVYLSADGKTFLN
jgi:hypothetical protein